MYEKTERTQWKREKEWRGKNGKANKNQKRIETNVIGQRWMHKCWGKKQTEHEKRKKTKQI